MTTDAFVRAPFVADYSQLVAAMWNGIVVGLFVLGLASVRVTRPAMAPGLSWANVVLGVWLILAPFVLGYSEVPVPLWNDIVVGLVVASLAVWNAVARPRRHAMG